MFPTWLLNPTLLLVIAMGCGWGYTGAHLYSAKNALANEKTAHAKTQEDWAEYRAEVMQLAAKAQAEQEQRDEQAREAARKTDAEHQKRLRDEAAARSGLLASIGSLRTQLSDSYAAAAAAEAASGDVARLATRAATAGKLLDSCAGEYGTLAQRAESTRLQALGLWQYIKDNRQCSTPFGPAAP